MRTSVNIKCGHAQRLRVATYHFLDYVLVGFTETFQLVSNRMEFALSDGLQHFRRIAEKEARNAEKGER